MKGGPAGLTAALLAALLPAQAPPARPNIQAYLDRADQAQEQGNLAVARSELLEAIRLNPDDPEAHARLGLVYRRMGMPTEAAESLERSIRLRPDPRLNVLLAFTYMDLGRYRGAAPLLSAGFESEQKDAVRAVIGQRLVECHLASGEDEQALAVVQKLRQIAPDDPGVLYLASKVYMNLWNGAFQRMLAKAPGSYHVHLIQAEALEAQERFAEAVHEYRQILKISPKTPGVHYRLGRALLRARSAGEADDEALAEFRKELEIRPGDAAALTEIGEIHLRKTQRQEALESFSQAVRVQPTFVPARVGLARVLIAEKQWSKALEHLETASRLAPDDEAIAYNLMTVYRGLGRAEDAKRAFETFQHLKQQKEQRRPSPPKDPAPQ